MDTDTLNQTQKLHTKRASKLFFLPENSFVYLLTAFMVPLRALNTPCGCHLPFQWQMAGAISSSRITCTIICSVDSGFIFARKRCQFPILETAEQMRAHILLLPNCSTWQFTMAKRISSSNGKKSAIIISRMLLARNCKEQIQGLSNRESLQHDILHGHLLCQTGCHSS